MACFKILVIYRVMRMRLKSAKRSELAPPSLYKQREPQAVNSSPV